MNLEGMFFPKTLITNQFNAIVISCVEMINLFTVESNFDQEKIGLKLNAMNDKVNIKLSSGGNQLLLNYYGDTSPLIFKIEFEGAKQRFNIKYEVNNSNSAGYLSYAAEPNGEVVLIKSVKKMLDTLVKNAVPPQEIKESSELKSRAVVDERIKEEAKKSYIEVKVEVSVEAAIRSDCKCPYKQSDISNLKYNPIEVFTDKMTRHFHFNGEEQVTIYECRYCHSYLMIESLKSGKQDSSTHVTLLSDKTANYLLSISERLHEVIRKEGIAILRKIVENTNEKDAE